MFSIAITKARIFFKYNKSTKLLNECRSNCIEALQSFLDFYYQSVNLMPIKNAIQMPSCILIWDNLNVLGDEGRQPDKQGRPLLYMSTASLYETCSCNVLMAGEHKTDHNASNTFGGIDWESP